MPRDRRLFLTTTKIFSIRKKYFQLKIHRIPKKKKSSSSQIYTPPASSKSAFSQQPTRDYIISRAGDNGNASYLSATRERSIFNWFVISNLDFEWPVLNVIILFLFILTHDYSWKIIEIRKLFWFNRWVSSNKLFWFFRLQGNLGRSGDFYNG